MLVLSFFFLNNPRDLPCTTMFTLNMHFSALEELFGSFRFIVWRWHTCAKPDWISQDRSSSSSCIGFWVPVDKLYHLFQSYLCSRGNNTELISQVCCRAKFIDWFLKVFWNCESFFECDWCILFTITRCFLFGQLRIQAQLRQALLTHWFLRWVVEGWNH